MAAVTGPRDNGHRNRHIVFGSRKSKLALWQTNHVAQQLVAAHPGVEFSIKEITTIGDRQIDQPLPEIGGKGLFTAELDRSLEMGQIDIAIHSLKDLPTQATPGVAVIPVLPREDPRDVLVSISGCSLRQLPSGSVVGTSSYRRQSQLLAIRPDLEVRPIRGNVPTRISKAVSGEYSAVVLAAAGVIRVGQRDAISEWLSVDEILPAPGQAAIAANCRSDDLETIRLIRTLSDQVTVNSVTAEREFLAAMGGGCSAPIAAYARITDAGSGQMTLTGRVGAIDGSRMVTRDAVGTIHSQLATRLATTILNEGGKEILKSVNDNSRNQQTEI